MIEQKLIVGRYIILDVPPAVKGEPGSDGFFTAPQQFLHIAESSRDGFFGPKKSAMGAGHVAKAHRNFQWLEWRPGCVMEVRQSGVDVLTGPMSGCWITRYQRNGEFFVGHVGTFMTPDDDQSVKARNAWNAFVAKGGVATGFNPARDWRGAVPAMDRKKEAGADVFAVVTALGEFYSVFTFRQSANRDMVRIAGLQKLPSTLPAKI